MQLVDEMWAERGHWCLVDILLLSSSLCSVHRLLWLHLLRFLSIFHILALVSNHRLKTSPTVEEEGNNNNDDDDDEVFYVFYFMQYTKKHPHSLFTFSLSLSSFPPLSPSLFSLSLPPSLPLSLSSLTKCRLFSEDSSWLHILRAWLAVEHNWLMTLRGGVEEDWWYNLWALKAKWRADGMEPLKKRERGKRERGEGRVIISLTK